MNWTAYEKPKSVSEVLTVLEQAKGIGLSSIDACSEVAMGLGYTLMEEVLLEHGMIRNPRFSEYFLPTSMDMPETVSYLVEVPEATGPFGAKGIGEPALIPTAPAILNAIGAAAGIRVKDLPATPEALWRLLNPLPESSY